MGGCWTDQGRTHTLNLPLDLAQVLEGDGRLLPDSQVQLWFHGHPQQMDDMLWRMLVLHQHCSVGDSTERHSEASRTTRPHCQYQVQTLVPEEARFTSSIVKQV